eukprot:scaffold1661_cov251-Pinguiococcus_pyrenoidosus.AAC.53
MVPEVARRRIERFKFQVDRRRALVSDLLQRRCVQEIYGLGRDDIWYVGVWFSLRLMQQDKDDLASSPFSIARTPANKPHLSRTDLVRDLEQHVHPSAGPLHFNCSHHGSKVVLVSEIGVRIGVDVVDELAPPRGAACVADYLRAFDRYFTAKEWACMDANAQGAAEGSREVERLRQFYRFWAVKEGYVKALGAGLGFDLQSVEFAITQDGSHISATSSRSGQALSAAWRFSLHALDERHTMAIAVEADSPEPRLGEAFHDAPIVSMRPSGLLLLRDPSSPSELRIARARLLASRSAGFDWNLVDADVQEAFAGWLFREQDRSSGQNIWSCAELCIWTTACGPLRRNIPPAATRTQTPTLLMICGFQHFLDAHQLSIGDAAAVKTFVEGLRTARPELVDIIASVELDVDEQGALASLLAALQAAEACGVRTRPGRVANGGAETSIIPGFRAGVGSVAEELSRQVLLEHQASCVSKAAGECGYRDALLFDHKRLSFCSKDDEEKLIDVERGLDSFDLHQSGQPAHAERQRPFDDATLSFEHGLWIVQLTKQRET